MKNLIASFLIIVILWNCSTTQKLEKAKIEWFPFEWEQVITPTNDTLKYGTMKINGKIKGIDKNVSFQFDLGATQTVLYENPLKKIIKDSTYYPFKVNYKKERLWNKRIKAYELDDLEISSEKFIFKEIKPLLLASYGSKKKQTGIVSVGTIGLDFAKNKYLFINYKERKIGVADTIPINMQKKISFIEMENTPLKHIVLKIKINNNFYNTIFDTGSSSWSLISGKSVFKKVFENTNNVIDSINVSSWQKREYFYKVPLETALEFGNKKIDDGFIYYFNDNATSDYLSKNNISFVMGNALFLNTTVVIDNRNKRFGVMLD